MTEELNTYQIEDRILVSLKGRGGVATAGDVAADTGLGMGDVEFGLRRMLSLYKSHLDVDDDGNLRYRFDRDFVRRGEEPARLWHDIKAWGWKAFTWVFKVWIMVTLVGYTVIFLLLLLALAIASMAAAASSDSDIDDDFIGLPFYFLARSLEWLFWISVFDDSSRSRRHRRGRRRREVKRPEKPFYQKIFDFVFGPMVSVDPLAAQQAFAAFVRQRRGVVTAAEWASRSGQSLEAAENALTAGLVRFGGDVDVSDDGTLLYRFDELKVSAGSGRSTTDVPPIWTKRAVQPPLTGNPSGTNWWIGILNTFNLVMASVVLFGSLGVSSAVVIGLGWVPFVFSLIFFAVPLARRAKASLEARELAKENMRRQAMSAVYRNAPEGKAVTLEPRIADDMMRDFDGDILVGASGEEAYVFERVERELRDARDARERTEDEVVFGRTVFSSDDDEKSLEEAELEAFDQKLAVELGVGA